MSRFGNPLCHRSLWDRTAWFIPTFSSRLARFGPTMRCPSEGNTCDCAACLPCALRRPPPSRYWVCPLELRSRRPRPLPTRPPRATSVRSRPTRPTSWTPTCGGPCALRRPPVPPPRRTARPLQARRLRSAPSASGSRWTTSTGSLPEAVHAAGVGDKIEVWVANDTRLPGRRLPQRDPGTTTSPMPRCRSLVHAVRHNMFPKESAAFSVAARPGRHGNARSPA